MLDKESTTNELMAFIYTLLSSVLIVVATYFAKKSKDNLDRISKKSKEINLSLQDFGVRLSSYETEARNASESLQFVQSNTCAVYCLYLLIYISHAYRICQEKHDMTKSAEFTDLFPSIIRSHEQLRIYMGQIKSMRDKGGSITALLEDVLDRFLKIQKLDSTFDCSRYKRDIEDFQQKLVVD